MLLISKNITDGENTGKNENLLRISEI